MKSFRLWVNSILKGNIDRISKMRFHYFSLLFFSFFVNFAQETVVYSINLAIKPESKVIEVDQKVSIHKELIKSDTIYFNDWNHAYSSTKTPLAKRFAEEFNRSFYLSSKNRLGHTTINAIRTGAIKLSWFRPADHPDIIGVILPDSLKKSNISLNFSYSLQLPDAKFSGYGYKDSDASFSLTDWLVTFVGGINSKADLVSNLNLDDCKIEAAFYSISMASLPNYQIASNLPQIKEYVWGGKLIEGPKFRINKSNKFFAHQLNEETLVFSNIKYDKQTREASKAKFQKVYSFLQSQFPLQSNQNFLITKEDYNLRPFYGLNQLPSIISPFSKELLNELKIIKAFSRSYVQSQWKLDKRKDHWMLEGLPIYLVIKYMETHHPDLRFLGILSEIFYLRTYGIAKMKFNEGFMTYTEFMLRNNLHQKANSPKQVLTKFNERIAVPYHVGIGIRYLESFLGAEEFEKLMEHFRRVDRDHSSPTLFDFSTNKTIDWFFEDYIDSRLGIDFSLKSQKRANDSLVLHINEKNGLHIPVNLTFLKDKKVVDSSWVLPNVLKTIPSIPAEVDQIALNPIVGLPELSKENNWKKINGTLLKKPISLKFIKDIEVPNRNQLFVNPISNYNIYDGISFGMRLHNKKLTRQNFEIDLRPQYSFLEQNLVGNYRLGARFNSLERKNFLTTISVSGSSFHYAESLRYNVIAPQVNFLFRTPDFRSNKRQAISLAWYNVSKVIAPEVNTSPEYSLFKIRHLFSNKAVINYLTLATDMELANSFSKISFNLDYRKLFSNGRQFQLRFFAGKFLENRQSNDGFFDFSITRPNDYLYQYQYLGRSETTGIYSQQFILAEGGIKSKVDSPLVGDYLISTNLMLSIWKWIELYGDMAIAKNPNQSPRRFWGTGVRLNLVPDYLEIYFPILNSTGFELDNYAYNQSLRFVLTIQPKQLATLFTRKWF